MQTDDAVRLDFIIMSDFFCFFVVVKFGLISVKGYGANCTAGYQCLKYGECRKDSTGKSKCQCLTDRTVYEPELEPFDQCSK